MSNARNLAKVAVDANGDIGTASLDNLTGALGYTPVNKAGDTMTGNLIVNANVGIGTSSPSTRLHTYTASGENKLTVEAGAVSQSATVSLVTNATTPGQAILYMGKSGASTNGQVGYDPNNNFLYLYTNNTERMRIDSAGRVTMPYQPSFKAKFAISTYQFPAGTVLWDTVDFNIGNHYNTSTGFFTAPVAGRYQINLNVQHYGGSSGSGWIDIRKNNGQVQCRLEDYNGATYTARGISVVLDLAVGDYVSAVNSTSGIWWSDNSTFSGFLIG